MSLRQISALRLPDMEPAEIVTEARAGIFVGLPT